MRAAPALGLMAPTGSPTGSPAIGPAGALAGAPVVSKFNARVVLTPGRRSRPLAAVVLKLGLCAGLAGGLSGCAVLAVADVAASAVVGVAGLAVDAAVGTVRIGGKVVGAGADALLGSDDKDEDKD